MIEQLERQAGLLRRSAATLLALGRELTRSLERYESRRRVLEERRTAAAGDPMASRVLDSDLLEVSRLETVTREALVRAEQDGQVLLESVQQLSHQIAELRLERTSASVRLKVGSVLSGALQAQVARVEQVLAVDAARDEIERAHQLAEIYREERLGQR